MNITMNQMALLKILYSEQPQRSGDLFVEIRQWETADGANSDLIVEHGQLNAAGELETECEVMPFFMSVRAVLVTVGI